MTRFMVTGKYFQKNVSRPSDFPVWKDMTMPSLALGIVIFLINSHLGCESKSHDCLTDKEIEYGF